MRSVVPRSPRPYNKPYLYLQLIDNKQVANKEAFALPMSTLEACIREVNADAKAGVPKGVIYVRYSRVAKLLRDNARLEAKLAELTRFGIVSKDGVWTAKCEHT